MRNAGGYSYLTLPEGTGEVSFGNHRETFSGTLERDTFTCCHCGSVVHVKPRVSMDDFGSMCRLCMKMVCPRCANFGCTPFEKRLEASEKRDQALRSYGL